MGTPIHTWLVFLLPPVEGSFRDREYFKHRTGINFDALGVAETAAKHTLTLLLNPARANRLIEHHARDQQFPSLQKVLNQLWSNTWGQSHTDNYLNAVQQGVNWVTLQQLMALSRDQSASPHTHAQLMNFLKSKQKSLAKSRNNKAFNQAASLAIEQFLADPEKISTNSVKPVPPGSPIGTY